MQIQDASEDITS